MDAIGVEGCECRLGWLLAFEVEPGLAILVSDHEFAACGDRGQREHQGRKHAGGLLGVAMAHEEAALVINEEFVKLGRNRFAHAESLGDARQDRRQRRRPMLAADVHSTGANLPRASDVGVDERVGATAVWRALGDSDEFSGLHWQERQRNNTDAVNLQPRREDFGRAEGAEITGPADRTQFFGKVRRDG